MKTVSEMLLQYRKDTTRQAQGSTKIWGNEDPLLCNMCVSYSI